MPYDLHLADRVREILRAYPGVSERKMFGGIAFMLNSHMCCGIVKTDLLARLGPKDVLAALDRPHTRRMDFTGRPSKSMLYVDAHGTDSDKALHEWIESACAFVRTMPPKKPAPRSRSRAPRPRTSSSAK